ncbi:hypothetical protein ANCDUO_04287 [Ancylostoma duodenale]|uniref:RRM domain-containing protein n=1 Tax=Ancylostoma duodenale TaxID=51022 RepID=A0A0C2DRN2_9BILA|nr:hypothetical protein ANCDUO_04287 [Ancylostoma duodenale]
MNEVITRAKAAVLGIRVPSPPRPAAPQPAPSSFAPDPAEFNKPLYMRGPPQPLQPQNIPAAPPQQQPVVPPVQNDEYHSAHRPAYPSAGSTYPPAPHHPPQNARPPAPPVSEAAQGYDKRYPRQPESKGYPPQPSYRQEDNYFNKPPQQHNIEPAPRFFGAPPRNPTVNRPPPPGMTMPPGFPQPPKNFQGPNGPSAGGDGGPPQMRPPFGGPPNSQFRGPPGHQQGRGPTEENHDIGGYQASNQQERYNGPVAKHSGGPHPPFAQDARNHTNANPPQSSMMQNRQPGPPARGFPPKRDSWRGDNGPPQSTNGPAWDSNAQKTDIRHGPNAGPPFRKPLLSNAPMGAFNDASKPPSQHGGPGSRGPPIPPRNPMGPPQSSMNRTPLLGPNFGAGPTPPRNAPSGPRYVELSRLPTEMLRPAVLEQFLRPSVPLQISSVKVVYSSQGIHMHTLVRFENAADADAVVNRDGELGIRVRSSTKAVFDEAVDGIPPARTFITLLNSILRTETANATLTTLAVVHAPAVETDVGADVIRHRASVRGEAYFQVPFPQQRTPISATFEKSISEKSQTDLNALVSTADKCSVSLQWFSERVRPSKITRTFYADGNASDRWIAEFESESLMERAQGIKRLLMGRSIKMCHISNEEADELLKIEDVYGERRKEDSEKFLLRRGRGGFRGREDKPYMRSNRDGVENREDNYQNEKPGSNSLPPRSPEPQKLPFQPVAATDDLVASLGPRGTVVSCCGFPSDVTLEDVLGFFQVRIRMGDDGVPTGECMLAMENTENASKAVSSLSGKKLRGQLVSLQLANP